MAEAVGKQGLYKRRTYFIKKEFQTGFILKFCLVLLAGILLSTALLLALSQDTLTSSYANSRLEIRSTGQAIMPSVILTNLITLGLISLGAVVVMVYFSHRIAGPLFRFEKDLMRVAAGDLSVNINLRKKDQLTDLSSALNHMVLSMHQKVSRVDERLGEIEAAVEKGGKAGREISLLRAEIRELFHLDQ
ncbi:MAG: methyl-accepting chemotaxis protein [Desulfobacter sp.]|nr:MAG: methyl-accepting chemotaxis protein [Desulfobacter sp.]